jgi:hypothetical protein
MTHHQKKGRAPAEVPRCGLCGATENLTQTECCGQWICDDEDQYVVFSYEHNSCYRNHERHTLCAYHYYEGHAGDWQTCPECSVAFETELYVYYGTNEYNFVKLENPPEYEPTCCAECGKTLVLGKGGYVIQPDGYVCEDCSDIDFFDFPFG